MKLNVLGPWKENYQDRLTLLGIIIGIWVVIRLIEEFVIEELVPDHVIESLPFNLPLALLGIIVILSLLHIGYMFVAQYHRRRNPKPLNPDYKPTIDIFICAHNEEKVIGDTIEHFLKHNYPDLKIYAINDRSTDKTIEIMKEKEALALKKYDGRLTIVDRPQTAFPGKSAGLNDALKISDGEVIAVFDADARVDPNFLSNMVMHLEDPLVGAVQAQKVITNKDTNILTKCQFHEYAMDTYLQMGRDSVRGSVELRGNGQLVKRFTLKHVGGWNEETLTDDLDLSTCLHVNGWDIRYSPSDKVYEEGVVEWKALIKQRRRWGEGSMRRHLNYMFHLFTPGSLSLIQIIDTLLFMGQFGIPIWIASDVIFEIIRFMNGRETYLTSLMIVCIGVGLMVFINQYMGLRIYKKQGIFESLINTLITNTYLLSTWTTVVLLTYRKIIFSRTAGKWVRTEHGLS